MQRVKLRDEMILDVLKMRFPFVFLGAFSHCFKIVEIGEGELKATNHSSLTQGLHQGIQQYPACDNNSQKVAPSLLLLVIRSFKYFLGKV